MNLAPYLLACALLPLAACSPSEPSTADAGQPASAASSSFVARKIHEGMAKARQEMASRDIDIGGMRFGNGSFHVGGAWQQSDDKRPHAVITPQGDLVIADRKIDVTPAEHIMLVDYRQQIIDIADAGMAIGERGADLGINAARQAIAGALAGKSDAQINAAIEPQAEQIKAAALQLCRRLPDLLTSQQQLAAALPAFKPYATMTQKDVDDCGKDLDKDGKKGVAVFSD